MKQTQIAAVFFPNRVNQEIFWLLVFIIQIINLYLASADIDNPILGNLLALINLHFLHSVIFRGGRRQNSKTNCGALIKQFPFRLLIWQFIEASGITTFSLPSLIFHLYCTLSGKTLQVLSFSWL